MKLFWPYLIWCYGAPSTIRDAFFRPLRSNFGFAMNRDNVTENQRKSFTKSSTNITTVTRSRNMPP